MKIHTPSKYKPGCRIEKTEATHWFLAKPEHEVQQTRVKSLIILINSLKYNCDVKSLPFSFSSVDLMNKSFNKTIGIALRSVNF